MKRAKINMPIYEYSCKECNKEFESLVLGSEQPVCPECKSENVGRMMSMCGFVSKSSGGGETVKSSASSSSCTGCTATSCASCGVS